MCDFLLLVKFCNFQHSILCRCADTAELLGIMAMDGVTYLPASSKAAPRHVSKAQALNSALRSIYPSNSVIPPNDVVALLDTDQASIHMILLPWLGPTW